MISINYSCRCSWYVVTFIWKLYNKNIEIISIVIKPHYKPVFIVKKLPIIFYLRLLTSTWTFLMTKIVLHSPLFKGGYVHETCTWKTTLPCRQLSDIEWIYNQVILLVQQQVQIYLDIHFWIREIGFIQKQVNCCVITGYHTRGLQMLKTTFLVCKELLFKDYMTSLFAKNFCLKVITTVVYS